MGKKCVTIVTENGEIELECGEYYTPKGLAEELNRSHKTIRAQMSIRELGMNISSSVLLDKKSANILKLIKQRDV